MSIYKLSNVIQTYDWGSLTSLNEMFNIENPQHSPQAEMWMGTHPRGCSKVADKGIALSELVVEDTPNMLGRYTAMRFGELPYLLKVIAADSPLSIQVHPSKTKAEQGFQREEQLGIPIDASNRNYKDDNHKPELVYALTFFLALNGFRPISEIISLFKELNLHSINTILQSLLAQPNESGLKGFFKHIMTLSGQDKQQALAELNSALTRPAKSRLAREAFHTIKKLSEHYQDDVGLFAPLLLNIIELAPGEAMFLHAETPHAYLSGTALEIMANSDNVLRAGLTSKHIDTVELLNNVTFTSTPTSSLILAPVEKASRLSYPVPVDDFCFDIVSSTESAQTLYVRSAEVLFCLDGEVLIETPQSSISLIKGESAFISNDSLCYKLSQTGTLARAYN
ncbi:mannose-6-phosphate isomerase, class I [Vibrio sinaloensis]|uniref:mannose-6-phosphate isomerase, class I n=1 Tax=Photobacterium sp. (strain ATCC 43367) TaxID=379097 RepID=UPI002062C161|nr:mannose-6-phosphate isomerase, class I [Vibrio sinaloensis]UPQ86896.1 mannose-6-phosphate isomerase, class I [Vibrio sinaloensis]